MTNRLAGGAVTTALLAAPSLAQAEVMDKVATPWEPARLVPLAIVTAICSVAARGSGWARTLAALVLAVAWATAAFSFDDLYDPYVGPAIRNELSAFAFQAYRVLAPVEALIPLAVVAALVAKRMRRGITASGSVS
jgi:hypothetical protein